MGRAFARQARYAEAVPLLERAGTASRGAVVVRTDLAFARLGSGESVAGLNGLRGVMNDDPSQMRAGLRLGAELLRRGENAEVAALAQGMLKHHSGSTVARNLLATAKFHAGDRAEAAVLFTEIEAEDPSFLPARVNLAKIDIIEGRRAQARERYLAILETYPEQVGTLVELARLDEQDGQREGAIEWLTKALDANPKSIAAVEYLVALHLRSGAVERALTVAQEAESWASDDHRVLLALARAQIANEKRDVAQGILQGLATRAGYDTPKLMQVAAMQQHAGALDDAAWTLQKAVQGDPDSVPARVALVAVLLRLDRPDRAMEAAEALRAAAPESSAAFGTLGEVLTRLGRHDEALEQFGQALKRAPSDFAAIKYAQALARVSPQAADKWLAKWVKDQPSHRGARQMLAERHLQQDRYDLARIDYEQLLQWRPQDARLLNNYAHILRRLGQPNALEVAERAQQLAPDDPSINDTLGWMLVQANAPQRGLAFLRNAHSRAGFEPTILYHIAVALHRLERNAEARRELESALASKRPFAERTAAQALLARIAK